MAQEENEVTSCLSSSNSFLVISLQDEYSLLLETYNKVLAKNKVLKNISTIKEKECNDLKIAYDDLEQIVEQKDKKNTNLKIKLSELEKKNNDLLDSFEKLLEGKKKLEMILGNQKSFGDKRGIGYINNVPSTSTTKFVKEKVLNKTPSFRKYVVQHNQDLYRKQV